MARVLVLTNDYPPAVGGIQSYVRDYVACLDPQHLVVAASVHTNFADAEAYDRGHDFPCYRFNHYPLLPTPPVIRALQRIVVDEGIDTVWCGAAAPLGLVAGSLRAVGVKKVVVSTHGHEIGWTKLPPSAAALRRIGQQADVVSYISQYTLAALKEAFTSRPEFVALPSGVDTKYFAPATAAQRAATRASLGVGDDPVVVCVSRLVRRKGQDELIAAWPRVRQSHPRARLIIVGEGPYMSSLIKQAHACMGDDKVAVPGGVVPAAEAAVIFTSRLPGDGMRDVLRAADVAAVPCRTRLGGFDVEGLGIVYLEAQACGIPVIAGDSGGAPETVTPDTGRIVPAKDTETLTAYLVELLGDAELRRHMGEQGRAFVGEHFSWPVLGRRLAEVLEIPAHPELPEIAR